MYMKILLCEFCNSKLNSYGQDNALLWDVRLCCKRCFLERLEEYNKKLNNSQPQGYKQATEASGDKV